jgi:hypothetical protein
LLQPAYKEGSSNLDLTLDEQPTPFDEALPAEEPALPAEEQALPAGQELLAEPAEVYEESVETAEEASAGVFSSSYDLSALPLPPKIELGASNSVPAFVAPTGPPPPILCPKPRKNSSASVKTLSNADAVRGPAPKLPPPRNFGMLTPSPSSDSPLAMASLSSSPSLSAFPTPSSLSSSPARFSYFFPPTAAGTGMHSPAISRSNSDAADICKHDLAAALPRSFAAEAVKKAAARKTSIPN